MTRRRLIRVEINSYASLVSGPGSFALLEEVTHRKPVWIARLRGFSASEQTARDVVSLAEHMGCFDIEITGPRKVRAEQRQAAAIPEVRPAAEVAPTFEGLF